MSIIRSHPVKFPVRAEISVELYRYRFSLGDEEDRALYTMHNV